MTTPAEAPAPLSPRSLWEAIAALRDAPMTLPACGSKDRPHMVHPSVIAQAREAAPGVTVSAYCGYCFTVLDVTAMLRG